MAIVLLVVGLIVVLVLYFAGTKPDTFRLHRSALIKAPPAKIFPLINDFHQWTKWSPWENKEGDELQRKYSGAEKGVGAIYEWEGKKTGTGRMEIIETIGTAEVKIKLDFFKPFEAHNTTLFTLMEEPEGTLLNWTMSGPQTFMSKLMGLVFNMEKMVGPDFEKGLAAIKAQVEK